MVDLIHGLKHMTNLLSPIGIDTFREKFSKKFLKDFQENFQKSQFLYSTAKNHRFHDFHPRIIKKPQFCKVFKGSSPFSWFSGPSFFQKTFVFTRFLKVFGDSEGPKTLNSAHFQRKLPEPRFLKNFLEKLFEPFLGLKIFRNIFQRFSRKFFNWKIFQPYPRVP